MRVDPSINFNGRTVGDPRIIKKYKRYIIIKEYYYSVNFVWNFLLALLLMDCPFLSFSHVIISWPWDLQFQRPKSLTILESLRVQRREDDENWKY